MTALWRPPSQRAAEHEGGTSAVSWTELFYDLVFVVAIANLGHRFVRTPDAWSALQFVVLFGMLWWSWASLTFLVDRYESDDALERLLAIIQMFGLAAFAAAAAADASFEAIAAPIAASYTVTRLVLIAMYARVWWHLKASRVLVGGYLRGFGLDTLIWTASIFVPSPSRYALWLIAMLISLATPWLMRRTQVHSPLSTSHLPERFGLFTILVLGESVAAVVAGLHADTLHREAFAGAAASFIVATGLWWIYFDNFEGSVVRRDPTLRHDWRPTAWIYAHFPLAVCLTTVGDVLAHVMTDEQEHGALAIICGTALAGALLAMSLLLVSTAGGDPASRRRRAFARLVGAVIVAVLAATSDRLTPVAYLSALGTVLVLEIVFDVVERGAPSIAP